MTEVITSVIDPITHTEEIVLRNKYGAEHRLQVRVGSDLVDRDQKIKTQKGVLARLEAEVERHLAATGAVLKKAASPSDEKRL